MPIDSENKSSKELEVKKSKTNIDDNNDNPPAPTTKTEDPHSQSQATNDADTGKISDPAPSKDKDKPDEIETEPVTADTNTESTQPPESKAIMDTPPTTKPEVEMESKVEINAKDVVKKGLKSIKPDGVKKFVTKSRDGADFWVPKTRLGNMVKDGTITTIQDALATGLSIREAEIVDILLPDLDDEVLDVNMVQRMTDSGRRVRFSITTVVGNGNGYVGLGRSKGKEVGPAIRKAIDNAKLNMISIRRGCGSWECGCGKPHTLPFTVIGKSGSTEVTFRPAPRGVGLAVGDVAKHILRLSGIEDAWSFTRGETRTTVNYSKAVFDALRKTAKIKTTEKQVEDLNIISGAIAIEVEESVSANGAETDITSKGQEGIEVKKEA